MTQIITDQISPTHFAGLRLEHNRLIGELYEIFSLADNLITICEVEKYYLIEKFLKNINESLDEEIKIHKKAIWLLLSEMMEK